MFNPISLLNILKTVNEIATSLSDRLIAAHEKPWEQIRISLDALEDLTRLHIKAITEVTSPIIVEGDLLSTCENFIIFIYNNPDFASVYRSARGKLEASMELSEFKKGDTLHHIKKVLYELAGFQRAVFILDSPSEDSYKMGDAFHNAKKLFGILNGNINTATDQEGLREKVFKSFSGREELKITLEIAQLKTPEDLQTPEDVTELVSIWCKAWQRHVQEILIGGSKDHPGLHYTISQLKMQKFKKTLIF
jgi:hypothetical protein